MQRKQTGIFFETELMKGAGLSQDILLNAIINTHNIIDQIDAKLLEVGSDRISQIVELANLSSIVGNLFGAEVAKHSGGLLKRNGPHKYPDLLATSDKAGAFQIVAPYPVALNPYFDISTILLHC